MIGVQCGNENDDSVDIIERGEKRTMDGIGEYQPLLAREKEGFVEDPKGRTRRAKISQTKRSV